MRDEVVLETVPTNFNAKKATCETQNFTFINCYNIIDSC